VERRGERRIEEYVATLIGHQMEPSLRFHFVGRVALGQVATLLIVAAGVGVLSWGVGGLYVLVAGVVISFLVTVAEAWVLLVEIHGKMVLLFTNLRERPSEKWPE
jgi:hypothetical protein